MHGSLGSCPRSSKSDVLVSLGVRCREPPALKLDLYEGLSELIRQHA